MVKSTELVTSPSGVMILIFPTSGNGNCVGGTENLKV